MEMVTAHAVTNLKMTANGLIIIFAGIQKKEN